MRTAMRLSPVSLATSIVVLVIFSRPPRQGFYVGLGQGSYSALLEAGGDAGVSLPGYKGFATWEPGFGYLSLELDTAPTRVVKCRYWNRYLDLDGHLVRTPDLTDRQNGAVEEFQWD